MKEVFDFLDHVETKACDKILFNIDKSKFKDNNKLFKKLNSDIWEFRTLYNKKQYRLFSFWDKTDKTVTVVIATYGIIKKKINKATELMNKYFNEQLKKTNPEVQED